MFQAYCFSTTSRVKFGVGMYFGYIPDPQTAFRRIHKLPPGHLLEFEKGQIKIRQYWDLPEYSTYEPKSEEECLEELEERLTEAVRIRLIADVPLGAMPIPTGPCA